MYGTTKVKTVMMNCPWNVATYLAIDSTSTSVTIWSYAINMLCWYLDFESPGVCHQIYFPLHYSVLFTLPELRC